MARNTLAKQCKQKALLEVLAYQYNDGSGNYTIRQSFELLFDKDPTAQKDLLDLFQVEGGFISLSYAEIRQAVFDNCDVDKIYKNEWVLG